MQKTFAWFKDHQLEFTFHDYKKSGANKEDLMRWAEKAGWEKLLNKSGLTWKKQSPETQKEIVNREAVIQFLLANNAAIRRPVIEDNDRLFIGFNEKEIQKAFAR